MVALVRRIAEADPARDKTESASVFTLVTSVLCGILFGCAPAWRARRADVNQALKAAAPSLGNGRDRLRRGLVVLEFALALTLLAAGGLAIHGLFKLASVDLGFRTEGLLTFSLAVPRGRLTGTEQIDAFYRELVDRVQAIPGVRSASVSTTMPVQWFGFAVMKFDVVGEPPSRSGRARSGFAWRWAPPGRMSYATSCGTV